MKKCIIILFVLFPLLFWSQDIIILKNNSDTIYCKIIEDKITFIEYRLMDYSDTTIYLIKTTETEGYIIGEYELSKLEYNQYIQAVQAFDSIVSSKNKYVPGIYKTFTEFVTNSPSITGKIVKDFRTPNPRLLYRKYKVYCIDSNNVKKDFYDTCWGYSDGKKRYIFQKYILKGLFHLIYPVDDYYVFNYVKKQNNSTGGHWSYSGANNTPIYAHGFYSERYVWRKKVVHGKTGEIYTLNRQTMNKLNISEQDKLWSEYIDFKNMDSKTKAFYKEQYYFNP